MSMTTLRVIAEDAIAHPTPRAQFGGLSRYARELTRGLIATAPAGCDVELIFAARPNAELAEIASQFDGAARVTTTRLPRRALATAWANGMPVATGHGLLHSPSLLAPLVKNDRAVRQLVVTVHDTVAWTHPASIGHGEAAWVRRMARHAARHADAIVVPSHAVANRLGELLDVAPRIRVVPGGTSTDLVLPPDTEMRASWLQLPERFVLAAGSMDPRTGIDALIGAAALPDFQSLPVLVLGDDEWRGRHITETAMLAGLPEGRVRPLGTVTNSDMALLLSRATVFVAPSDADGFGLAALEALAFGTPLVHSDSEALVELASGAGICVYRNDAGSSYSERLAAAVGRVVAGGEDIDALRVLGRDRAKAFSWRAAAAQVWQLHADL
jgi:glycosyltransferase involved in cell wall biosynthesis